MVVEIENAFKSFSSQVKALNGLDLKLDEGQVLGLFGHNGAGKTTTIKLILGLLAPTSGTVRVMGKDPLTHHEIKSRMGFLPENVQFYDQLSGREVLQYFAKLKGENKQQVEQLLEQFQLGHAAGRAVKTYSKGMRQRLGLAQAMLGEPKLMLLDEPTVGLDPVATKQFYEYVAQLQKQGCTLIICSHVLPGIEHYIDRALIMSRGHEVVQGSVRELNALAHLPVQLDVVGDNLPTHFEGELSRHRSEHGWHIEVSAEKHISTLQQISQLENIQSMFAKAPSLEDLYHFFIGSAFNKSRTQEAG